MADLMDEEDYDEFRLDMSEELVESGLPPFGLMVVENEMNAQLRHCRIRRFVWHTDMLYATFTMGEQ